MAEPLIGSTVSLISKRQIRYEGVLYSVDGVASTVALQNVRSFGTEGRRKDGPQIPASDKVYNYIIFRGSDIIDINVREVAPAPDVEEDPAIVSTGVAAPSHAAPLPRRDQPRRDHRRDAPAPAPAPSGPRALPGMGAALLDRRPRGTGDDPAEVSGEFNFEEALGKFDKEGERSKLAGEAATGDGDGDGDGAAGAAASTAPAYDKGSSFFDSLSCSAMDHRSPADRRSRREEERRRNTETFGAMSLADNRDRDRHRGYRRGYGGGGHRGYGGGGGGGGGGGDGGRGRGGFRAGPGDRGFNRGWRRGGGRGGGGDGRA